MGELPAPFSAAELSERKRHLWGLSGKGTTVLAVFISALVQQIKTQFNVVA